MATKRKGIVLWFNPEKGYGEITGENKLSYFFNYHGIHSRRKFKTIASSAVVAFDVADFQLFGALAATNVRLEKG